MAEKGLFLHRAVCPLQVTGETRGEGGPSHGRFHGCGDKETQSRTACGLLEPLARRTHTHLLAHCALAIASHMAPLESAVGTQTHTLTRAGPLCTPFPTASSVQCLIHVLGAVGGLCPPSPIQRDFQLFGLFGIIISSPKGTPSSVEFLTHRK